MKNKTIHIVSFDIPFPADYGGVIDVFYRIKALHQIGFDITLHCFQYGKRKKQNELDKYCSTVFYYPRKKSILKLLTKEPFIVSTRKVPELLENLNKDNAPILFEGLHTCGFLNDNSLKNRLKFARMHNIEHDYYNALAKNTNGFKKLFFKKEAKKLQEFLPILNAAQHLLVIQENDYSFFKRIHSSVYLLPISLPEFTISEPTQTDDYCLFHGNLSVSENTNALIWLVKNVEEIQNQRMIVAGKNPSKEFVQFCQENELIIVPNPTEDEMQNLIQRARIHLLYTEQSTGIKIKLLNAFLSSGRVIVNPKMIEGTSLSYYAEIAHNGNEFSQKIRFGMKNPLTKEEIQNRWKSLLQEFDSQKNVKTIEGLIQNN